MNSMSIQSSRITPISFQKNTGSASAHSATPDHTTEMAAGGGAGFVAAKGVQQVSSAVSNAQKLKLTRQKKIIAFLSKSKWLSKFAKNPLVGAVAGVFATVSAATTMFACLTKMVETCTEVANG